MVWDQPIEDYGACRARQRAFIQVRKLEKKEQKRLNRDLNLDDIMFIILTATRKTV